VTSDTGSVAPSWRIETTAVHTAHRPDPETGAVAAPIHLATTFERDADGAFSRGFIYARDANPNRRSLERALAELEGGAAALAFASGQAATSAVFQALRPGDHVIAPTFAYYGTPKLLRDHFVPWGLEATFVDMRDPGLVQAAVKPNTRLIWVESPSNPLLTLADISTIARIAHETGARCAVDNTWATPVGQRPIELGADIVMHATTKYLGGHGDVMGGALVFRVADELHERVRTIQADGGAIPAPFDCWLVLRGIRTLPWRMRAHTANAALVADALAAHAGVRAVHYPGMPSHPQHELARRQMLLFGGMVSFEVRGERAEALAVAARTRLFTRATSLGGVESLIEHRASVEGASTRAPESLLRISVGLEHPDDLIADLEHALS
jgi:cystathionine gamma-synthase